MNPEPESVAVLRARRLLLAVLVVAIGVPRLMASVCVTDFGADGGYYSDIAQNVRDGLGLSTDVSVFHQGFPHFPYPTPVYPLWPLVYGLVSRILPLKVVGVWLPTLLYFVVLPLAYAVGKRLGPRLWLDRWLGPLGSAIHGGHVLVLVTALTSEFSSATTRPYTEGLAFTLLFGLCVRSPGLWRRLGLLAGLELGGWLFALFLTRSQFVVVALAAFCAVPLALWSSPRRAVPFLFGFTLVGAVGWGVYVGWVGTFLPGASLGTYIRFDLARVPSALSAVPIMVETSSAAEHAMGLLEGFPVAFGLYDTTSTYYHLHHAFILALPIATFALFARWRRMPVLLRFAASRDGPHAAFFTAAAIGLTLSLHTVHKVYGSSWVFGSRHAIPSLLLVGTSMLFLLRARSRAAPGLEVLRPLGLVLLLVATYEGWRENVTSANSQCLSFTRAPGILSYRPQLRGFFQGEQSRLGSLTVAVERPEAQRLAWRTPGVGFHWLSETTTVDDLRVMVSDLGVQYVVDFDDIRFTAFAQDEAFAASFALITTFKESSAGENDDDEITDRAKSTRVYGPRCGAFSAPPVSCVPGGGATTLEAAP
ncbi:MAG: hypothetical protein EXR69_07560 [Myxococcales bacterium]|nr:hypothetical protein [Myxococcales bacterium]